MGAFGVLQFSRLLLAMYSWRPLECWISLALNYQAKLILAKLALLLNCSKCYAVGETEGRTCTKLKDDCIIL